MHTQAYTYNIRINIHTNLYVRTLTHVLIQTTTTHTPTLTHVLIQTTTTHTPTQALIKTHSTTSKHREYTQPMQLYTTYVYTYVGTVDTEFFI